MLAALAFLLAIDPRLEAPWACAATYPCTQGNGGATSHTGRAHYAWDFGLPLGTEIAAARGGIVTWIEMRSRVGGCSQTFVDDANYIVIDHGDGTSGLYLHLEAESSRFERGDRVEAGETIARVGQTGWSCGPHLHFQVQEVCGSWWCQSVSAEFRGQDAVADGQPLTRENCELSESTLRVEELRERDRVPDPESSSGGHASHPPAAFGCLVLLAFRRRAPFH